MTETLLFVRLGEGEVYRNVVWKLQKCHGVLCSAERIKIQKCSVHRLAASVTRNVLRLADFVISLCLVNLVLVLFCQVEPSVASFDPYDNDMWASRCAVLARFQQAARKVSILVLQSVSLLVSNSFIVS